MGRAPCCEKVGLKKGRWTADEDQLLVDYIKAHGEGGWRSLPKNAGLLRCGKSCRLRWVNYLREDLKRGNISPEEEENILQLQATLGNRWSLIAGHLPGRTDNEIKNYWNAHLSKKAGARAATAEAHDGGDGGEFSLPGESKDSCDACSEDARSTIVDADNELVDCSNDSATSPAVPPTLNHKGEGKDRGESSMSDESAEHKEKEKRKRISDKPEKKGPPKKEVSNGAGGSKKRKRSLVTKDGSNQVTSPTKVEEGDGIVAVDREARGIKDVVKEQKKKKKLNSKLAKQPVGTEPTVLSEGAGSSTMEPPDATPSKSRRENTAKPDVDAIGGAAWSPERNRHDGVKTASGESITTRSMGHK